MLAAPAAEEAGEEDGCVVAVDVTETTVEVTLVLVNDVVGVVVLVVETAVVTEETLVEVAVVPGVVVTVDVAPLTDVSVRIEGSRVSGNVNGNCDSNEETDDMISGSFQ